MEASIRLLSSAGFALALLFATPSAEADLLDDAARLAGVWSENGARVQRLPSIFLEHGRPKLVSIEPLGNRPIREDGCTTIAALGPIAADFSIDSDPIESDRRNIAAVLSGNHPPDLDESGRRARSAVGAAKLERCGVEQRELERVLIRMNSGRGAVELIVAHSAEPLGDIEGALPERAFGLVAPRGNPGRPIEPGPVAERVLRAERRAREEGAEKQARVTMRSSGAGTGQFSLRLGEGCHRVELFAEVPTTFPRRAPDLDAEVRDPQSGRVLVRDRSDAADSRLDFCIGDTTTVDIPYVGAAGAVSVTAVDSIWSIPSTIPARWGPRARAGLALALRRRRAPAPRSQPVFDSLGVQGATSIPIELEPGGCYLAALSLVRGESSGLRFSATVGDRYLHEVGFDRTDSAALAFCSEVDERAVLKVEVRGASAWWTMALWPMGSMSP